MDVGDQRMSVDPSKGEVMASTPDEYKNPTPAMSRAPDQNLELVWAHGFRSFDTQGNLKYDKNDNVVFSTAGVGVVYLPKTREQQFFNMHKEDIVAMAMHPNKEIVATGQMAGKALNEAVT